MSNVINMSKGQKINMSKSNGDAVNKFFVGVRWEQNRFSGEADFDIDIAGFLTKEDRNVKYPENIVNYSTYDSGQKWDWIEFSGDNRTGDDANGVEFNGEKFDESFIIDTTKIPSEQTEFTICLSIFRAVQRVQNFGMISNAELIIYDYNNPQDFTARFDLSEDEKFERVNAAELGRLYRHGDGFKFQAIGSGYTGGMTELFKQFGLDIEEGRD